MMRNLVEVLRLLSTSKPSASGAGLELLLAARGSEDGAAQLPQKQSSQAYVQREADAAWDCVQVSCPPVKPACSPSGLMRMHMCIARLMLPVRVRRAIPQPYMLRISLLQQCSICNCTPSCIR